MGFKSRLEEPFYVSSLFLSVRRRFPPSVVSHLILLLLSSFPHFSYRIHGGLAVECDYIVTVQPSRADASTFAPFTISKTYSAFRTLGQQLQKVSRACQATANKTSQKEASLPANVQKLCKYCDLAFHLIDGQRTAYLGKVNFMYVKVMAKQRKQILDDVLSATVNYFPSETASHPFLGQVATILETFFLMDHVESGGDAGTLSASLSGTGGGSSNTLKARLGAADNLLNPLTWIGGSNKNIKKSSPSSTSTATTKSLSVDTTAGATQRTSVVVPITRRNRQNSAVRSQEEEELSHMGQEARLLVDDDRDPASVHPIMLPNYSQPTPTVRSGGTAFGLFLETNPWIFVIIAAAAIVGLQYAAQSMVSMDGDIFMLVVFASFCLGLHTPRPMVGGFDRPPSMKGTVRSSGDRSGRKLLRRSMMVLTPTARRRASEAVSGLKVPLHELSPMSVNEDIPIMMEEEEINDENGATMGSPMAKFPEGAEIGTVLNCWSSPPSCDFHVRGPTYSKDKKKVPSAEYLFPCRGLDLFLTDACPENVGRNTGVMGGRLREVPTFIINFRLPWGVLLFYCEIPAKFVPFIEARNAADKKKVEATVQDLEPSERATARWLMAGNEAKNKTLKIVPVVIDGPWVVKSVVGGKPALIGEKLPINYVYQAAEGSKALYLEADLDIAASSAARGILSVTRSYTQILTLNLGFVIQGNEADELPEQMLMGARLHGIDPLTAPSLPPMDYDWIISSGGSDEESV